MPEKSASAEIRRHIRKILMQERDPIGVSDVSEAADEYDGYIDRVHNLITRGASEHEIAAYLRSVEVAEMGMVDAKGLPLLELDKRIRAAWSLKGLSQLLTSSRHTPNASKQVTPEVFERLRISVLVLS